MSAYILAAIRQHPQLKGSLKFTALELAHRASRSGHVSLSYRFLGWKTGLHPRTIMRHIARLIALGILRKHRIWRAVRWCAMNSYRFLGVPAQACSSDSLPSTLPPREREKEKSLSLAEDIRRQRKALHFLTPGSPLWARTQEEIARLEALRRC
jgi:hypothetical protein